MSEKAYQYLIKSQAYHTPKSNVKRLMWDRTGGKCWYCGKQTSPFGKDKDSFCIDHFIARENGGTNEISNLVPCCTYCNITKGKKNIEEFRIFLVGKESRFYFEKAGLS